MTRNSLAVCLWLLLCSIACGLPPEPARYMNDYAGVVPDTEERLLDEKLQRFEEETSNQIVVAVFKKLEQGAALGDFTYRTAKSWKVGQADKDNGIVLFVFVDDRKMRIEVGYGLEGAVPDITAKRIIENEIGPGFKRGDYPGGIEAGVDALIAASKGEYEGTGRLNSGADNGNARFIFMILVMLLVLYLINKSNRSGRVYTSTGTFSSGGWGSSGGGGFGGGFSGGGGGFGGGGASGGW